MLLGKKERGNLIDEPNNIKAAKAIKFEKESDYKTPIVLIVPCLRLGLRDREVRLPKEKPGIIGPGNGLMMWMILAAMMRIILLRRG
mmetsp:Transcript_23234/g.32442  ORF Transcript_23234/g.32442 Transcript_23234/m.32442 type:complete len:87 (+) Transcript_23234:605-865(+)